MIPENKLIQAIVIKAVYDAVELAYYGSSWAGPSEEKRIGYHARWDVMENEIKDITGLPYEDVQQEASDRFDVYMAEEQQEWYDLVRKLAVKMTKGPYWIDYMR